MWPSFQCDTQMGEVMNSIKEDAKKEKYDRSINGHRKAPKDEENFAATQVKLTVISARAGGCKNLLPSEQEFNNAVQTRRRRNVITRTCADVDALKSGAAGLTVGEINSMTTSEFGNCLG